MTLKNKDTIAERVEIMLKTRPETRDNYNLMVLMYLKEYHYTEDIALNYMVTDYQCQRWAKNIPSVLTICRIMTKLKDKYPPSEKVQEIRKEQEENYRSEFKR